LKGGVSWLKKHGNELVVKTKDEISGKKQQHQQDYQFEDQSMFYQMDQIESLKELPTQYNNAIISKLG
jgi:hypothetical protein